ncbi:hypothetical protein [Falsiporphyromonas endometrii]|uniref:Uncharacterized protein n=1 Tax=Falsiporphyromonas endometrii TaxID=1387297 RepID=A0ABV9K9Z5_9PORP
MEISILLTVLLMIISLVRLFFQAGEICLISEEQINPDGCLSRRAVKFVMRDLYLLNIVALNFAQKATQITLIQPQNLKFEG